MIAKGSVDNQADIDRVFKEIADKMPPLRGVQHAAMILDDGSIPEIDYERYMKVFRPKAVGTWMLHEATKDMDLDHFICYSSISAVYGNPGQVSYVGANSFLDNFSQWRRAQGLPATTINWGVIGDVGFVARNAAQSGVVGELLYKQGWKTFSMQQATWILEQMLLNNPIQRVGTDSDWEMIGGFYPHSANSSRFAHLVSEKELSAGSSAGAGDGALRSVLFDAKPEERNEIFLDQLKDTFARVLGTVPDKLETIEPVTKYGLDSLMANQIRNWIQSNVSIDYSMMKIMRGPSMEEMSDQIVDEIMGAGGTDNIEVEARSELDRWILRTRKVDNPRLRLFCLPYCAGGASILTQWHELLPENVEVCAIQFPGREERGDEKPYTNVNNLIKKLAEVMEPLLTTPVAFYSHSSGSWIALELVRYLRDNLDVHPVKFMVGGAKAAHLESDFQFLKAIQPDEVYKDKNISNIKGHLRSLEISDSILENDQVFNEMLPSLRADILLGKNYDYNEAAPLDCPIVAFAGKDDSVFNEEQIKEWEKHSTSDFSFNWVEGGHMFCRDSKEELLETIKEELSETAK